MSLISIQKQWQWSELKTVDPEVAAVYTDNHQVAYVSGRNKETERNSVKLTMSHNPVIFAAGPVQYTSFHNTLLFYLNKPSTNTV